jgi:hypothetical protein
MKFTYPKKPKMPKQGASLTQLQNAEQRFKEYNAKVKEVDRKKAEHEKVVKQATTLKNKTTTYTGKGCPKKPKFPKASASTQTFKNYIAKYAEWEKKCKSVKQAQDKAKNIYSKLGKMRA